MYSTKNSDGSITVPRRAEHPDGTIGDGVITLRPGDEGYEQALEDAQHDAELASAEDDS